MTATTATTATIHTRPDAYARRWLVLGVMSLSLVLVVMSVSGLNVALPALVRDLAATAGQLQWIVDAYALVFAASLLTAGAIGDRFGRKKALLAGFGIFGIGAAASALAMGADQLIATRALMGLGAALIMPATLSIIVSVFPPDERPKAIAIWAGVAGLGGILGQVIGGIVVSALSWPWLFLAMLPVIAVVVVATVAIVPHSRNEADTPLDLLGAGLSLVAMAALVFGIIEAPGLGLTNPAVLAAFAVALLAGFAFVSWQRRAPHPMLPLHLMADARVRVGLGAIAAVFAAMFALFFLLTQYLQFVQSWSPLQAGFANLPIAIGLMIGAPKSHGLVRRFGTVRVVTVGLAAMAVGFAGLATLEPTTPYWVLVLPMALIGLGAGAATAPSTSSVMGALPTARAGLGSALNDTSREVGAALGIAILGSIAASVYRSGMADALVGARSDLAKAVEASAGAGFATARAVGGTAGDVLREAVVSGFTDGVAASFAIAAAVIAVAAIAIGISTRRRRPSDGHEGFDGAA